MTEDQSTRIRTAGWTPCPWSVSDPPRVYEHPDFKNPKGADEITVILDREQAARAEGVAEGRRLERDANAEALAELEGIVSGSEGVRGMLIGPGVRADLDWLPIQSGHPALFELLMKHRQRAQGNQTPSGEEAS